MSMNAYSFNMQSEGAGDTLISRDGVANILQTAALIELIKANQITLAMIRPNVANSMKPELIEGTAEATLERNIYGLDVFLRFSFIFDLVAINEFYAGKSKEDQKQRPPERDFHLASRWDEFVGIMTSGPTIGLLLSSTTSDATESWRAQIGGWNIEQFPDPKTLRGKFGVHNYNNLLHGSDSSENVQREIKIIAQCIDRSRNSLG